MAWDDVFDPPKGFQLVGNDAQSTFDPPQGFQIETPAQQPEPQAQPGGWRGMLDQFNPIGTAEAKTPKQPKSKGPNDVPMEEWPATEEEFKTQFGREPQGDIETGFYSSKEPPLPSWRDNLDQMTAGASEQKDQEQPRSGWRGMLDSMLSPITNLPETYRQEVEESTEQMKRGWGQLTGSAERPEDQSRLNQFARGVWNAGVGGPLSYTLSPITAAERSIVSRPIENVTGFPKEYTEFGMNLAIPGMGFPRAPGMAGRVNQINRSGVPTPPAQRAAQAALGQAPAQSKVGAVMSAPEKLFSPETVGPTAEDAAALIREHTGQAARSTAIDANNFEGFYRTANNMTREEKINLQNYVDGGKTATAPATAEGRALADGIRGAMQSVKEDVQSLPKHVDQAFRDEYFPHFWKNPDAAREAMRRGGIGKAGSSASLHARTVPTIEDGIRAGLEPKWDNPVEASMRYITSMRQLVARERVLQAGQDAGTVVRGRAESMGASGGGAPAEVRGIGSNSAPMGVDDIVPPGYVQLQGPGGQGLYAPENWARIYNNWLSAGFHATEEGGNMYDALRRTSNAASQSLLALSGYHAFTMAEASLSTELSRAIMAGREGRPMDLVKSLMRYPAAPLSYAMRGKKGQDIYLHPEMNTGTALDREIMDLGSRAGARFVGKEHALDFEQSKFGDYVRSFRRGGLAQIGREYASLYEGGSKAGGTAKALMSTLGRTLETVQRPLFQKYIPAMKTGAYMNIMEDWLKANPLAGDTEKVAQARKAWDSVDNRYGEMVQDNIFWRKSLKQGAMLSMLSYSWNVGGIREIGGGIRDIARTAAGQGAMTRKADYTLGTAMTWGVIASAYQYLKTGSHPVDSDTPYQDTIAPRTGGTVETRIPQGMSPQEAQLQYPGAKNFRQQGKTWYADVPERIIPPGIMKDVFGYYEHPMQEIYNKLNPAVKMGMELFQNKNWRGDPIFQPRTHEEQKVWDSLPVWLGNAMDYAIETATPISIQNIRKGNKPGSALNPFEQAVGIRQANTALRDPFAHTRQQDFEVRRWQNMKSREQKEKQRKQQYGGPQ